MEKIYNATGTDKLEALKASNSEMAYRKRNDYIDLRDFALVGLTNQLPSDGVVNPQTTYWTLNGLANSKMNELLENFEIIIIEPFEEQIGNPGLRQIREGGIYIEDSVTLSDRATILMPFDRYQQLRSNPEFTSRTENLDLTLYVGDKELATKMLLYNNGYVWFDLERYGYHIEDEYDELGELAKRYKEAQRLLEQTIDRLGKNKSVIKPESEEHIDVDQEIQMVTPNSTIASGLTSETEGDFKLDETSYASISIGKKRKNQEDAVALVRDANIPNFKMMAVADGMGGEENGEVASHLIVTRLKKWFETLSEEQKMAYYTGVGRLEPALENKIRELSIEVLNSVKGLGGATIVCAIIGKNDTLVMNVGDSRAYIAKNGKLNQVSIEDSVVQEELEAGNIPYKDAMRFHFESNIITQCIGERNIRKVHSRILNNDDYDMILLFSDGVTDCLSEDEIALICRTSDKSEIAKRLVRHASIHDSIPQTELIEDYFGYVNYNPGGADNETVAVTINKRDGEEGR